MTAEETLAKIRENLTGDTDTDMKYLDAQASLAQNSDSKDRGTVLNGISKLMYEIMPEDKKKSLTHMMYIGDKRLDDVYKEAFELTRKRKIDESLKLTQQLYDKITAVYRETEDAKYMCFRNPFEHQLYLNIYTVNKKLVKSPFDLPRMLLLHAYNLVEKRKPAEAADVLNVAIRYNPVNTDTYFELAECYKVLSEPTKLLEVTKETIMISPTPYALSRCYANLGYYCVEKRYFNDAICFYYESLRYDAHPGVESELIHIRSLTGMSIVPPSGKDVVDTCLKYGIQPGPDEDLVKIARSLADESLRQNKDDELTRFYLLVVFGLTRDSEVEKILNEKFGGVPDKLLNETTVRLKQNTDESEPTDDFAEGENHFKEIKK